MSRGLRWTEEQLAALTGKKNLTTQKTKTVAIAGGYKSRVRGERTIGGKTYYFKSLWEIQTAQTLEFYKRHGKIKDWFYEPRKFTFPQEVYGRSLPHSYTPDFQVIFLNGNQEWIEVKGVLTAGAKKKIKRMNETYPEIKIVVHDKPWFKAARSKNLHVLMGWEKLEDTSE